LPLAVFAFVEGGLGRSVIGGNEAPVFLVVLGTGLVFEGAWYLARGTNAVTPISDRAGRTGSDAGATW
jgi:ABC-type xylose transport system permease subunit